MSQTSYALLTEREEANSTMKALVFFCESGQIGLEKVPIPKPRAGEAVIHVTLITICGTDLHILRRDEILNSVLMIIATGQRLCFRCLVVDDA
jgi:alcohol dehydrogenase